MSNLNPVIAQALAPFIGSMGMFSANPVADASAHFDASDDTFTQQVDYLGLPLDVELSRSGNHIVSVFDQSGNDWYPELSERALRKIVAMAYDKEEAV